MQDRTTNRMLYSLKVSGPQMAASLAEKLSITPVAVRQMLGRLHEAGLVDFEDSRESVGRPKRFWHLTDTANRQFPDNHSGMTVELLASIKAVFGNEGLDRLISHRETATLATYREGLAPFGTLTEKVEELARIRSAEGYMAEAIAMEDGSILLVENHCPICVAATACQKLCSSELSIFQSALGPAVEVRRVEHLLKGARRCAYMISQKEAAG
ncbi:helix-turn-helix transcriptional regulator [Brucella sp. IR073]|uniref:helix-turn-helix transcriptional regulator n=1 Tax=unclassified Brucella TaxID=2632610 RepID=UPI003B97D57C